VANNRGLHKKRAGKDSEGKMKPIRVQRKRTKGWRMPPNTVYVGRQTMWGNMLGKMYPNRNQDAKNAFAALLEECSKEAASSICFSQTQLRQGKKITRNIEQLRGKNLACFCPLDEPCHADILLELANR
jgi:hypothetical protein